MVVQHLVESLGVFFLLGEVFMKIETAEVLVLQEPQPFVFP